VVQQTSFQEDAMSIARLREVARHKLPLNISDVDQIDELRVLMAAGLLVALRVRTASDDGAGAGAAMIRVLAITAAGRRLLARSGGTGRARSEADHSSATP
jgi:hypothetical protein